MPRPCLLISRNTGPCCDWMKMANQPAESMKKRAIYSGRTCSETCWVREPRRRMSCQAWLPNWQKVELPRYRTHGLRLRRLPCMAGWSRRQMTFRLRAALAEPESANVADIDAHLEKLKALRSQYEDSSLIQADAVSCSPMVYSKPLTSPPPCRLQPCLAATNNPFWRQHRRRYLQCRYVDQGGIVQDVQASPRAYETMEVIRSSSRPWVFRSSAYRNRAAWRARKGIFAPTSISDGTGLSVHVHALADGPCAWRR
jgi:hypothetical protein